MDSLDFINTHKLILNNKEIDTIETYNNSDNNIILSKSSVNNAINQAISGGNILIGEYKTSNNSPLININNTDGLKINNKNINNIIKSDDSTTSSNDNNLYTAAKTDDILNNYAKLTDTNQTITTGTLQTNTSSPKILLNNSGIQINSNNINDIIKLNDSSVNDNKLYTASKTDNLLNNKVDTSNIKTSTTSTNTDVYACSYVNTELNKKINNGSIIKTNEIQTNTTPNYNIVKYELNQNNFKTLTFGDNNMYDTFINGGLSLILNIENKVDLIQRDSKFNGLTLWPSGSINLINSIYNNLKIHLLADDGLIYLTQLDTPLNIISPSYSIIENTDEAVYDNNINVGNSHDSLTYSGSNNIFNNIIYAHNGISDKQNNTPNNIILKFVNDTTLNKDYAEFINSSSSPALRIYEDKTYSPIFTTQNADYAELFEVYDESIPIKDYEFKFITLFNDKVKIASNNDDYILGVYSSHPGIIGNYNLDNINSIKNIQVGLLGRLIVGDNGLCKPNFYCKVDKNGFAEPYNNSDGNIPHYRVMKRIDNNKILIMFK